jgi:hypothetical protein
VQQAAKSKEEYEIVFTRQRQSEPPKPPPPYNRMRDLYEAGEYKAVLELGAGATGERSEEFSQLMRSSHIALADQAKKRREYDLEIYHLRAAMTAHNIPDDPLLRRSDRLRINLSQTWYRKGNGLMKEDLPGAIVALEKSVGYYSGNNAARLKLKQAKTMQRNLEKIKRQ